MREVPVVRNIIIPNTYGTSSNANRKCLVLHLGFAERGRIGIVLTGVKVNVSS